VDRAESQWVPLGVGARTLGVSYSTLWEAVRRGESPVPAVKVGRVWRLSRPALEALAQGTPASAGAAEPR
jgi:excisionase family DNA binding protein